MVAPHPGLLRPHHIRVSPHHIQVSCNSELMLAGSPPTSHMHPRVTALWPRGVSDAVGGCVAYLQM